jgi:restriction system protein
MNNSDQMGPYFLIISIIIVFVIFPIIKSIAKIRSNAKSTQPDYFETMRILRKELDAVATGSLHKIISANLHTLIRKRQNLIYKDDYGNENKTAWMKELGYVYDKMIINQFELDAKASGKLSKFQIHYSPEFLKGYFVQAMDIVLADVSTSGRVLVSDLSDVPRDGVEYESLCCQILQQAGWKASKTPGSGDQGADIIAENGEIKAVIQCKHYDSSVGNKAVQEVIAAKIYYGATHAVVVSNNTFTHSARSLAAGAGVILLHHDDLPSLLGAID